MKHYLYIPIILYILFANSCCALKKCPYREVSDKDSTYTLQVVTYHDTTVFYRIKDSVVTNIVTLPDTSSFLRTDIAQSRASVSGGKLYHELRNIAQLVPVNVNLSNSATTVRNRTITRTVEVPAQLTKWQNLRIHLGDALVAIFVAAALFVIVKIVRRIIY